MQTYRSIIKKYVSVATLVVVQLLTIPTFPVQAQSLQLQLPLPRTKAPIYSSMGIRGYTTIRDKSSGDYTESYAKPVPIIKDGLRKIEYVPLSSDLPQVQALEKAKSGKWKEVLELLNEAIRIDPQDVSAYDNRGFVRFQLSDFQGALEDFDQAVRIDPSYKQSYYSRGGAQFRLGNYQASADDYTQAIKLGMGSALTNRAMARIALSDFEGAVADLDKAIKSEGFELSTNLLRGHARAALGNVRGATEDFQQILAKTASPSTPSEYHVRGEARAALGDKRGAIEDLQKVAENLSGAGRLQSDPRYMKERIQEIEQYVGKQ